MRNRLGWGQILNDCFVMLMIVSRPTTTAGPGPSWLQSRRLCLHTRIVRRPATRQFVKNIDQHYVIILMMRGRRRDSLLLLLQTKCRDEFSGAVVGVAVCTINGTDWYHLLSPDSDIGARPKDGRDRTLATTFAFWEQN